MSYTQYLREIAEISAALDEAAKLHTSDVVKESALPVPYLVGKVLVAYEGEVCAYFEFEDDYVLYHDLPQEDRYPWPPPKRIVTPDPEA